MSVPQSSSSSTVSKSTSSAGSLSNDENHLFLKSDKLNKWNETNKDKISTSSYPSTSSLTSESSVEANHKPTSEKDDVSRTQVIQAIWQNTRIHLIHQRMILQNHLNQCPQVLFQ